MLTLFFNSQQPQEPTENSVVQCTHTPNPLLCQIKHRNGIKDRFIWLMLENYSSLFVLWQPLGATAADPILTVQGQTELRVLIKPQDAQNLCQNTRQIRKNYDNLWTSIPATLCQKTSAKAMNATILKGQERWKSLKSLFEILLKIYLWPHTGFIETKGILTWISMGKTSKKSPWPNSKSMQPKPAAEKGC